MNITIIHAYSTTNSGDGLLVEEAVAIARTAFPTAHLTLLALDPASFDHENFDAVLHAVTGAEASPSNIALLTKGLAAAVLGRLDPSVRSAREKADLVIAVGGGYLRTKNLLEAAKTFAAHGSQLPIQSSTPSIYLPQSIGPLRYATKGYVKRRLRNARSIYVRDDRSLGLLSDLPNVVRAPDMALLGLPATWSRDTLAPSGNHIGLVARELPGRKSRRLTYVTRLRELHAALPGSEILVQAAARGNNDLDFYRDALGLTDELRSLKDAVQSTAPNRPSAIVSVRLHGSLESIRSGVPSVHLSYERKGWGAYDDLGVSRFVHNAFDFDPETVASQARELASSPEAFWTQVEQAVGGLASKRGEIVSRIHGTQPGSAA